MKRTILALTGLAAVTLGGCVDTGDQHDPDALARQVAGALAELGNIPSAADGIEYNLFNLDKAELRGDVTAESCDAVDEALAPVCTDLQSTGEAAYCYYNTAFFYANNTPRCAVRLRSFPDTSSSGAMLAPVYMLDFSGTPSDGPPPLCGNGVVDEDEECDDGNHELWDGCDSQCITEPFNGCEAVIQDYYQRANLATIDQYEWDGPRSHVMVNRQAAALREVTPATCAAAISTADEVCTELTLQMPFVGSCQASGRYRDEQGPACSIRFDVWFSGVDSQAGAYTTSLPGILAFTIR